MKYPAYPAYQPTSGDGLRCPLGWRLQRLRFAVATNPVKSELANWPDDMLVSFVPMEAVGETGGLSLSQDREIAEVYNGYSYFAEGDVVVAKITPCFENGKGAWARGLTNGIGFGTTELHVMRSSDQVSARWLLYVTQSHTFRKLGEAHMYGAGGQKRVPEDFIKNHWIGLPELAEQEHIAKFLDWKTGQIDALICRNERLLGRLMEKRTTVITRAVTMGIEPSPSTRPTESPWLPEIPSHWQFVRFGYETVITEGQIDPEDEQFRDLPLIAPNHMESGTGRLLAVTTAQEQGAISGKYAVSCGDLVYSKIRPHLNKCVIAPFDALCSADAYPIKSAAGVHPKFLLFWMLARPFLDFATESSMRVAMPKLNRETLSAGPLAVPPLDEQRAIVTHIESVTSRIDRLASKVNAALKALEEYRSALTTAAVTGQIDVRGVAVPTPA